MNIDEKVRALARSQYWQSMYSASKECHSLHLFDNETNFSGLQMLLLYWMRVYSLLYEEFYNQEWTNLHIDVINDDIHCDAFLYWRSKELEKRTRQYKEDERKNRKSGSKPSDEEKTLRIYKGNKKN